MKMMKTNEANLGELIFQVQKPLNTLARVLLEVPKIQKI